MKRLLYITFIFLSTFGTGAFAQNGFLRGNISDEETGELLLGATVSKKGTTIGSAADFDGNFSLVLDTGVHTIVFQFVSYQSKIVENVVIKDGEVTFLNVKLGPDIMAMDEVVVSAEALRDTESAVLSIQKKSATVLDGISSQHFKKVGDSNLAGAIKRVTGVSVQGGKYVYVRGLGDRYTRTTLNGLSIPGLDPERNDVQIDLFPTNILENVIVHKTFSPELPGDFTGGVVNVETKSFPDEKKTSISIGLGYNPNMHFNNNFVTSNAGSKTDFLGFDDGTRKIPFDPNTEVPQEPLNDPELERLTKGLTPELGTIRKRNALNTSLALNHGNQIDKGNYKLGYSVVMNYQNKSEYFENSTQSTTYTRDELGGIGLNKENTNIGDLSRKNVLWSALLSTAIKWEKHQISMNLLRTQNGISESLDRLKNDSEETGQIAYDDIISFSQRSITNATLSGKHQFNKLLLNWGNSVSISRVYDPNYSQTLLAEVESGDGKVEYSAAGGQGGGIFRFWRDLNEQNENFKLDASYELAKNNTLKAGGSTLWKWRDFSTNNYVLRTFGRIENDPSVILATENVWTPEDTEGTYLIGALENANQYDARSSVNSVYLMQDVLLFEKLRTIYGARLEYTNMFYTGQNQNRTTVFDNQKTLDELNILPSLNLVYSLTDNINIRSSYGRTLARPSFKEKSIAQILDPITGLRFNGNIDLQQTNIDNFDLRFENFFKRGQMFSVSAYYKKFDGHIELVRLEAASDDVQPRNAGSSVVYGLEFEFRKSLNFITDGLSVGTNFSLTKSELDMREINVTANGTTPKSEFEQRTQEAREGEEIDFFRPMSGQAPFAVNAYLNFSDQERGANANISYNVQGETLSVVAVSNLPDVYTRSFHSLNFNVSKSIGIEGKTKIGIRANNLLGSKNEDFYKGFGGAEETFSLYRPGTTFTVSYGYTF